MKKINVQNKLTIQLWLGVFLAIIGVILIFIGLYCEPLGEIHNSVLIAFGEIATFSGALIGVDYKYQYQRWRDKKIRNYRDEAEENDLE